MSRLSQADLDRLDRMENVPGAMERRDRCIDEQTQFLLDCINKLYADDPDDSPARVPGCTDLACTGGRENGMHGPEDAPCDICGGPNCGGEWTRDAEPKP